MPDIQIPQIPSYPDTGNAGTLPGDNSGLMPPLPSISPLDILGDQSSIGTTTENPTVSSSAVGTTTGQSNMNTTANPGGTQSGSGSDLWQQLGTWLKSIALSGTLSLIALVLIVLSVYVAVTRIGVKNG